MVDPIHFTNYDHTLVELEEKIIFSVLVAGKNALTTAKRLEIFLASAHWKNGIYGRFVPFQSLKVFTQSELSEMLHDSGVGCHSAKGRSVYELVHSGFDLRECDVEDLERIYGIGPKTARFFILHTRRDVEVAALDVHILRYMGDRGLDVPKNTPGSPKKYKEIEMQFLRLAKESGMTVADFDLMLWNIYRTKRRLAS